MGTCRGIQIDIVNNQNQSENNEFVKDIVTNNMTWDLREDKMRVQDQKIAGKVNEGSASLESHSEPEPPENFLNNSLETGAIREITHSTTHGAEETIFLNDQCIEFQSKTPKYTGGLHGDLSIKTSEGDATKTKKSISAPHLTELKSYQDFVEET